MIGNQHTDCLVRISGVVTDKGKVLNALLGNGFNDFHGSTAAQKATVQQFNDKELEIEFVPQGTLAERIRCGGAGLGGILTKTGLGTVVEEGKRKIEVDGEEYLLELPLHADVALIGASICDEMGNSIYKGTTQNFNPMMATAADLVIVETKELVPTGSIPMENVHTPGAYVDYIVK